MDADIVPANRGSDRIMTDGDLRAALEQRRSWFFESQLRRFNLQSFRDVDADSMDSADVDLLYLIGESDGPPGVPVPGIPGAPSVARGLKYLDNGKPLWTNDERKRRDQFGGKFIGRLGDWLEYQEPHRLTEAVARVAAKIGAEPSGSVLEAPPEFPRKPSNGDGKVGGYPPWSDGKGQAISRAMLAAAKPWLLPELYHPKDFNSRDLAVWLDNLEQFIAEYENELYLTGGLYLPAYDPGNVKLYEEGIRRALEKTTTDGVSSLVRTRPEAIPNPFVYDNMPSHWYNTKVTKLGGEFVDAESFSSRLKYWTRAVRNAQLEVYLNKENSDMGLCHLIRMLYLFGTMPAKLSPEDELPWRKRAEPGKDFDKFFKDRAGHDYFAKDEDRKARLERATAKLRIILTQSAAVPRSAAVSFSTYTQESLRQSILGYKFWLDEPFHTSMHKLLWDARGQLLHNVGDKKDTEMEYWSENHYIMFASSEYLAGQLWEPDTFQPAKAFLGNLGLKYGEMKGEQRKARGKARVLKWLNNRLLMGWTEFNSSGYYREHLWSLLNLVDFALDKEIREKATVVTDLLLFDVARFLHKGAMGAVGGRSQFGSKGSGMDNALGDAIEIIFGTRGLFSDSDSEIGAAFATSTYQVPEVLLEIGTHPPEVGFTDRSRVSITFEEAPKYGITYSQQSDQADSVRAGFAAKREQHYPFLKKVNDLIVDSHPGYSAADDDNVFWWTTSAYFNKQVITGSIERIERWGLNKTPAFGKLQGKIEFLAALEGIGDSLLGAGIGFVVGGPIGGIAGGIYGALEGEKKEDIADTLSAYIDGSTRTRANIMTYRNPDIMLSSIQNFRVGQLNFQSSVNQATVNSAVNVFSTSGFEGLDISPFLGGVAGFLVGGPVGAALGAGLVYGIDELFVDGGDNAIGDETDGPSWWTGYWSLPMVAQAGNAAIVAYDFNGFQDNIADSGSHFWFPRRGFDNAEEVRCGNYSDANAALFEFLDIGHIGPKGFWIFGKYVHPAPGIHPADRPEAYIGVFSNQRPDWLDDDSDPDIYERALDKAVEEAHIDKDKSKRYFDDQDWYVAGKNIWIVHVGNKAEYGDFETFKQRVSSARVHLDDTGDLECHYHQPMPDGSTNVLALKFDDPEFHYANAPLQTDLYPRFENPFLRSGRVEWGQRGYVIEYKGKTLRHDFFNYAEPVRGEDFRASEDEADLVRGLVCFVRTTDEDMDEKTVGAATVRIGCATVAEDQVIAAGPVDDDTDHDAEWIFFGGPAACGPDLTIDLRHRAVDDGDDEADWNMRYSMKALMGDYTLRECTLSFSDMHFDEDHRNTGARPFSILTDRWRRWEPVPDSRIGAQVVLAARPAYDRVYYDYCDLLVAEPNGRVRHRRLDGCLSATARWAEIPEGPAFTPSSSLQAVSRSPGQLIAAALDAGALHLAVLERDRWQPWQRLEPSVAGAAVPLASPGTVHAGPSQHSLDGVELVVPGADGQLYANFFWRPSDPGSWRKIEPQGFTLRPDGDCVLTDDRLFVLDTTGALWVTPIVRSSPIPVPLMWTKLTPDGFALRTFTVVGAGTATRVLATSVDGNVWDAVFEPGKPPKWSGLGFPGGKPAPEGMHVAGALPYPKHLDAFAVGADGTVYTAGWNEPRGWGAWTPIVKGAQGFQAAPRSPLLVHRVNRQLELLAETTDGNLVRSWWS